MNEPTKENHMNIGSNDPSSNIPTQRKVTLVLQSVAYTCPKAAKLLQKLRYCWIEGFGSEDPDASSEERGLQFPPSEVISATLAYVNNLLLFSLISSKTILYRFEEREVPFFEPRHSEGDGPIEGVPLKILKEWVALRNALHYCKWDIRLSFIWSYVRDFMTYLSITATETIDELRAAWTAQIKSVTESPEFLPNSELVRSLGATAKSLLQEKHNISCTIRIKHVLTFPPISYELLEYLMMLKDTNSCIGVKFHIPWHPYLGVVRWYLLEADDPLSSLFEITAFEIKELPDAVNTTALGLSTSDIHDVLSDEPLLVDEEMPAREQDGATLCALYVRRQKNSTDPTNMCPGSVWKPLLSGIRLANLTKALEERHQTLSAESFCKYVYYIRDKARKLPSEIGLGYVERAFYSSDPRFSNKGGPSAVIEDAIMNALTEEMKQTMASFWRSEPFLSEKNAEALVSDKNIKLEPSGDAECAAVLGITPEEFHARLGGRNGVLRDCHFMQELLDRYDWWRQQYGKEVKALGGVPSLAELRAVKIGDCVKVCHNGERFWCTVSKVGICSSMSGGEFTEPVVTFQALVNNKLVKRQPWRFGDSITIEYRHVCEIAKAPKGVNGDRQKLFEKLTNSMRGMNESEKSAYLSDLQTRLKQWNDSKGVGAGANPFSRKKGASCSYCGAGSAQYTCGRCRKEKYCDAKCQKKHWKKGHKKECKPRTVTTNK